MPDLTGILTRLEGRLGARSGDPLALDGGITNRNYRVAFGGRDCVVRLPGKDTELLGIDREAERLAARRAAELGIAPEVLATEPDCSVTAYAQAQPVDPERLRADPSPFARALRSFHDSGLVLPSRFWVPSLLDDYARRLAIRGARPPAALDRARGLVGRIAERLPLSDPVACHDDLLPGNLLAAGDRSLLVDWEYAGMGHRLFDLGNLAVNNGFDDEAEARLLEAYFGQAAVPAGRRAALKLMRIISELDFDFDAYAELHFERLQRAAADPRLEEYLRAATA